MSDIPVSSSLDITSGVSPLVVKASPGRLHSVIPPSGGSMTIYDADSAAGAVAANAVATVSLNTSYPPSYNGAPVVFNWPMLKGIVVSLFGSGSCSVSFS